MGFPVRFKVDYKVATLNNRVRRYSLSGVAGGDGLMSLLRRIR